MNLKRTTLLFAMLMAGLTTIAQEEEKEDGFKFGGALRYNFLSTNYESGPGNLNPQMTWDTWRINVDGSMSGVDLSFEYRFYPTFGSHFIHHGYLGYAFSEKVYMKLGVSQVPFGITPYVSHSWWFNGPYYVGLEDDYDMGINFEIKPAENLELALAYFRQAEPEGPGFGGSVTFGNAGSGRYSYDIVPGEGAYIDNNGETVMTTASLRELDQLNARLAYHLNDNIEVGLSAQVGGIYNSELDDAETGTAFAGHVLANYGNFNLMAEFINYNFRAKADNGQDLDVIQMGAYGYEYWSGDGYTGGVAANTNMYVFGIAYTVPVEWGPITSFQPYIDYTLFDKLNENFHNTHHLLPGIAVSAGAIYTYIDYAVGKNQPWLTDSFGKGLGSGIENPEWNSRFNINLGYYF